MQEVYGGLVSNPRNRMDIFNNIAVTRTFAGNVIDSDIPGMDGSSSDDSGDQPEEPVYNPEPVEVELPNPIDLDQILNGALVFKLNSERFGIINARVVMYHDNKIYLEENGAFLYRVDINTYEQIDKLVIVPWQNSSGDSVYLQEIIFTETGESLDFAIKETIPVTPASFHGAGQYTITFGRAVTDQEIFAGLRVDCSGEICTPEDGDSIVWWLDEKVIFTVNHSSEASTTRTCTVSDEPNIHLESYIYNN